MGIIIEHIFFYELPNTYVYIYIYAKRTIYNILLIYDAIYTGAFYNIVRVMKHIIENCLQYLVSLIFDNGKMII